MELCKLSTRTISRNHESHGIFNILFMLMELTSVLGCCGSDQMKTNTKNEELNNSDFKSNELPESYPKT